MSSSIMRQGQPPVDLAALTINPPPVPAAVTALNPQNRERETQLLRRIRELEEDLRLARVENDKQVGSRGKLVCTVTDFLCL